MNKKKNKIKARFDYFKSIGFRSDVAMDMAKHNYPYGTYFRTPVD